MPLLSTVMLLAVIVTTTCQLRTGVAHDIVRPLSNVAEIPAVSGTAPVLPQSTMCFHKAPLAISRGGRSEALGRSLCVIRVGIHQW